MLLPDQTYADYVDRHLTKPDFKSSGTSSSYDLTADFFENIPDFVGATLPAFLYSPQSNRQPADADHGDTPQTQRTSHSSGPVKEQSETSTKSDNCDDVLRLCEDFLCRHRMRPDFFCQYHKALSSTTPSPKQSKASPTVDKAECSAGLSVSKEQESSVLSGNNITDVVERFTKFSAIYTLPVARRRKTCNKTTGNITDASSSNEAVHLQQRLKSLSTELLVMRNRLHVESQGHGRAADVQHHGIAGGAAAGVAVAGSKAANYDLNASSPNLNLGTGGLSANALQQHANGSGQNTLSKHAYNYSQTLPSNAGSGAVISARNTSIPHPLPHQLGEVSGMGQNKGHSGSLGFTGTLTPASLPHSVNGRSNTLPMRSSAAASLPASVNVSAHQNSQQLPSTKHVNPCQSVKTLPFGFGSAAGGAKQQQANRLPKDMQDLIHLAGPLNEHAVMHTLQARFNEQRYFTNVGSILLSINPYLDVGNPLTLTSTRDLPLAPQLQKIVQEAVRQQSETGYPQAIILSGTSGAGKTANAMLMLRQLFAIAGGGQETDAFKHLAAAFTVLRSLGSAKTTTNSESSRIGQFIEVQVTDGALYRTKIHCYFLDQTRVIRPLPQEKNYHIFYQLLAGLNREERQKLHLEGYSPANLRYLRGDITQNEHEDAVRFQAWKTCLGILGIPFLDVVRVLAAVLLLGNVQFIDGGGLEVDVKGETELNSVASLLGVPPAALFRGLTTRTHNVRGQLVKSVCGDGDANMTRDCLAKALYCRLVATIVRRANSLKRLGSTLGTLSSDSNESVHNQADAASQHTSTIGGGNAGSKSMAALNNAVRHATDGFIGILDMFGFEEPSPHAQLEHLCINLCAETMQHFYNTHIFKSSVESCRDEGIVCETEVDYVDNVPCIDLISSLRTGLLSLLDMECSVRGTAESYVTKLKVQHRCSTRLETRTALEPDDPRLFAIRHFAGRVEYDTTDFLDTNRDVVPDDLVAVFYKHSCNFGFATHLFGSELKALYAQQHAPRGLSFRISPTSHSDLLNGDEPVSTLTQDFHTRLDNLLRTLVHARPHFVRCIRSNTYEQPSRFDRVTVVRQIRSLQVLETVNLMASGFPHRMRFKQFNARYRMLAPFRLLRRTEDKALEDCQLILQYAMGMEQLPVQDGSVTLAWAPGKRHVFISEGIRQHLEHLRTEIRNKSATRIQSIWRGWCWRKKMGSSLKRSCATDTGLISALPAIASTCAKLVNAHNNPNGKAASAAMAALAAVATAAPNTVSRLSAKSTNQTPCLGNGGTVTRPRPQPIAGTPPPDPHEKCDQKIIQQTCSLFGLDLERPPPVPLSRAYTITANSKKLGYPQSRIMKMNFPEDALANPATAGLSPPAPGELQQLKKGDTVTVVGASSGRGHLVVEHKGQTYHVPFQYMELSGQTVASASNAASNANMTISSALMSTGQSNGVKI
ncbi:unconventional myosin-X isoform X1 [Drosophila novamexicana]|uniref:unconventional myosin-X isoform X1 n=1 Tax=Drosophila novamexicana TaxID=47314 RepID=UPI0011E5DBDB|nr:unconventional myosin-X isoform X1 [Drosophila novamexicana]XP_030561791.1 unconventional myosin-X isoform X1 [Drosophila novamexicana]XP_030561792.1 unconventional myosin-X isoform X1 [Drosophila novamexicana]